MVLDALIVLGALTLFGEGVLAASHIGNGILLAIASVPALAYFGILYVAIHEAHSGGTRHWASPARAFICAGQGFGVGITGLLLAAVTGLVVLAGAGTIF